MPAIELTIRCAVLSDVDALAELAANTFRDTYGSLDDLNDIEDYVQRNFTPTNIVSNVDDASSTVLVALVAQQYIGYAHLRLSTPPDCVRHTSPIELARFYLRQDAIGKGYGVMLMQAVLAEARRKSCNTIWLCVYERNQRAREFYKHCGFTDVGTTEFIFGGQSYMDPVMSFSLS